MNDQTHKKFYIHGFVAMFFAVLVISSPVTAVNGATQNPAADFDGDGKSDISVFRPSDGFWYIAKSSGGFSSVRWGLGTDTPIAGDYDGDGKADYAVFRRVFSSNGTNNNVWYILRSSDNSFSAVTYVPNSPWYYSDRPVPEDFDGDGKTDVSVFRSSDAIGDVAGFRFLQSSNNSDVAVQFGMSGWDRPVPADYDGDGKADVAVYRGNVFNTPVYSWLIVQSSNGATKTTYFGLPTDRLVPADYDGDKKADIAVWRPSNGFWYRLNSSNNTFSSIQFGHSDDKPTPGDYDGDGKTDLAVFRPSNGFWYLQRSTEGFTARQFGLSDDIPIPNTFVR